MSVNATGVFLCYKHAARRMIEQGNGGRIIGMLMILRPMLIAHCLVGASSLAGMSGDRSWFAYTASKFAVRGMTQAAGMAPVNGECLLY